MTITFILWVRKCLSILIRTVEKFWKRRGQAEYVIDGVSTSYNGSNWNSSCLYI